MYPGLFAIVSSQTGRRCGYGYASPRPEADLSLLYAKLAIDEHNKPALSQAPKDEQDWQFHRNTVQRKVARTSIKDLVKELPNVKAEVEKLPSDIELVV